MKEIILTQGKIAIVDDSDFEWLNAWKWYALRDRNAFYARRASKRVNGAQEAIIMHRLILGAKQGQIVDYADGNTLNNQRANLRICTTTQNAHNRKISKNKISVYKGVSLFKDSLKNKWRATININGKSVYLGRFSSEIDAAFKYDEAAKLNFGPFAKTNF